MITIDCKSLSQHIRQDLSEQIDALWFVPGLAVVVVGENPASMTYVKNKRKACDEVGIYSEVLHLPDTATTDNVRSAVENFAYRDDIHGIMVQLPLPSHINEEEVLDAIPPCKDVDGLTHYNMGMFVTNRTSYSPCTPRGVMSILSHTVDSLEGRHCVIIGRSDIVGKPLATLLTRENATVTLCHSKTKNLSEITRQADIIICAVGKAGFLTADMVSDDTVVIDVGINRDENGKLCGDVCHDGFVGKLCMLTPVPGGVGVMTVTSLLQNTYEAAIRWDRRI